MSNNNYICKWEKQISMDLKFFLRQFHQGIESTRHIISMVSCTKQPNIASIYIYMYVQEFDQIFLPSETGERVRQRERQTERDS